VGVLIGVVCVNGTFSLAQVFSQPVISFSFPLCEQSGLGEEIWNAVKTENKPLLLDLLKRAKDVDLRVEAKVRI
jgi:hypothetical protein